MWINLSSFTTSRSITHFLFLLRQSVIGDFQPCRHKIFVGGRMRRKWALLIEYNCLFVCFRIHKQINLILFFVSKPLTNLGTFRALFSSSSFTLNVTPAAKSLHETTHLPSSPFPSFLSSLSFTLFTSNPNFSLSISFSLTNTIIALNLFWVFVKKNL